MTGTANSKADGYDGSVAAGVAVLIEVLGH